MHRFKSANRVAPNDNALVHEPIHDLRDERKVRSSEVLHLQCVRNRAQRGMRVEGRFGCTAAAEAARSVNVQK